MTDFLRAAVQSLWYKGRTRLPDEVYVMVCPVMPSGTITCIDGGSGVIVDGPDFCLAKCRVVAIMHQNNRRVGVRMKEGYVVIRKSGPSCTISLFGLPTVCDRVENVDCAGALDTVRAGFERHLALQCAQECRPGDMIVFDGEGGAIAVPSGVIVCGVSKKTRLVHDGVSIAAIDGPAGAWSVRVSERTVAVKLHSRSKYVFRIDVWEGDVELVVRHLAATAVDAAFVGYPHGLVEADARARVTFRELDIDRIRVGGGLMARDVHAVLDRMNAPIPKYA